MWDGGQLPRARVPRELGGTCIAFHIVASEVTQHLHKPVQIPEMGGHRPLLPSIGWVLPPRASTRTGSSGPRNRGSGRTRALARQLLPPALHCAHPPSPGGGGTTIIPTVQVGTRRPPEISAAGLGLGLGGGPGHTVGSALPSVRQLGQCSRLGYPVLGAPAPACRWPRHSPGTTTSTSPPAPRR